MSVCQRCSVSLSEVQCQSFRGAVPICQTVRDAVPMCQSVRDAVPMCQSVRDAAPTCQSVRDAVPICQSLRDAAPICQSARKVSDFRYLGRQTSTDVIALKVNDLSFRFDFSEIVDLFYNLLFLCVMKFVICPLPTCSSCFKRLGLIRHNDVTRSDQRWTVAWKMTRYS